MDIYYVVGVTTILYLEFGVIVNIISKEDNFYCITIGDIPQLMHISRLCQIVLHGFRKEKEMGVLQTLVLCFHISMQGELRQQQVHPHSNI